MRQMPIAVPVLLMATLTFSGCSDSVTAPHAPLGLFVANLRFDSILFTVETGPRGTLSGSGRVNNDTGDSAPFTVGGRNPEVTFTVTTSHPAIAYYDGAQFQGAFRSAYEIVGSMTFRQGQPQTIPLTFHRAVER